MLEEITAEKGLPQNLEAERSVLGAILLDPSALSFVVPVISKEDFFPDTHRRIYAAMLELSERSAEIDILTLKEELDRAGSIEKAGGAAYLTALLDGVPDVGNVEHYARIVKEKATLRRLIRAGQKIVRDGAVRGARRRGPAERRDERDLRHRRRGGPRRVRADRPGRAPQPRDHRGRPRPAGHALGPRDGVHRARPDDLGPAGHGSDHHRGPPLGRKDLLRAEHRPARRHPRGPLGRLLLARNVQGAARLPRALLGGRRRREEGPRRLRLQGGDAAARPRPVQDPRDALLHRRQRGPERAGDARQGPAPQAGEGARPAARRLHAADGGPRPVRQPDAGSLDDLPRPEAPREGAAGPDHRALPALASARAAQGRAPQAPARRSAGLGLASSRTRTSSSSSTAKSSTTARRSARASPTSSSPSSATARRATSRWCFSAIT